MAHSTANSAEDNRTRGGVYDDFLWTLFLNKHARFEDRRGHYSIDWSFAVLKYFEFQNQRTVSNKRPQFDRKQASNTLRAALLNHYKSKGACEYKQRRQLSDRSEVTVRHFQMPSCKFGEFMERPGFHELLPQENQVTRKSQEADTDGDCIAVPQHAFAECSSCLQGLPDSALKVFPRKGGDSSPFMLSELSDQAYSRHPLDEQMDFEYDVDSGACVTSEDCTDLPGPAARSSDPGNIVQKIYPGEDDVQGGQDFCIILNVQRPATGPLPRVFFGMKKVDVGTTAIDTPRQRYTETIVGKVPRKYWSSIRNVDVETTAIDTPRQRYTETIVGKVPPAPGLKPGMVIVTVEVDGVDGVCQKGKTRFKYVDRAKEAIRVLVNNPEKLINWLRSLVENSERGPYYGHFAHQEGASSSMFQDRVARELDIFESMVYAAAETNADQFLRVLFSTSAGKVVFSHYRFNASLPEEVARDNNHQELAEFLEEVHEKLSRELGGREELREQDFEELIRAVQWSSWNPTGMRERISDSSTSSESSHKLKSLVSPEHGEVKQEEIPRTEVKAQLAICVPGVVVQHRPCSLEARRDFADWVEKRRRTVETIRRIARKWQRSFAVTHKTTWLGVGAMAAGLLAVPFTAGASVVFGASAAATLAAGGAVAGGGALAVGSSVTRYYMSHIERKEVRSTLDDDAKASAKMKEHLRVSGMEQFNSSITTDIWSSIQNTLSGREGSVFDPNEEINMIADGLEEEIESVRKLVRDQSGNGELIPDGRFAF